MKYSIIQMIFDIVYSNFMISKGKISVSACFENNELSLDAVKQ